ncbi:cytidylate kinase-like family protein [uncultured Ilyobacter sp.]|uniref:cytidylate kinase-like family protein n=1 Tax=uncultured Ilyobacter sp. TaxID=544433 RepID=UPI0029BFBDDE|nr:cytidylate kinase-like family protein [uncultured Ilyobacter sp.]
MKNYVITIGREFGSGGPLIGKILAEKLGIKFYDAEIIELTAKKNNMKTSYVEEYDESMEETIENKSILAALKKNSIQDKLYKEEVEVIKDIASKESCVIIGRCGNHILKDMKNAIHIFIYAPYGFRFNRISEVYPLTKEATEKMISQVDKARHDYYKRYTKTYRGDREGKHILMDSSLLGIQGTAEVLKQIVIKRFSLDEKNNG